MHLTLTEDELERICAAWHMWKHLEHQANEQADCYKQEFLDRLDKAKKTSWMDDLIEPVPVSYKFTMNVLRRPGAEPEMDNPPEPIFVPEDFEREI